LNIAKNRQGFKAKMVVQFAATALYERRMLLNKSSAVRDRRYIRTKLNHYRDAG
jgi:hypothetical protein